MLLHSLRPAALRLRSLVAGLCLLSTACMPAFQLSVKAGACLNPTHQPCMNEQVDSRPMRLRVYPLSACPARSSVDIEQLLDPDQEQTALRSIRTGDPVEWTLERTESLDLQLTAMQSRATRCLLFVAIGRQQREGSLLLLPRTLLHNTAELQLDGYEIFRVVHTLNQEQYK